MRRKLTGALAILMAGVAATTLQAKEWQATVGAESPDRGSHALAFLPNELWIQTGDSIRWTFPTHERHTVTFLTPGQIRPANFGPVFGVSVGCPGSTPDGSSFDGSSCVNSDILLLPEDSDSAATPLTYSVTFPSAGNFKMVCLAHADMTGMIHVRNATDTIPYDQSLLRSPGRSAIKPCYWPKRQGWKAGELPRRRIGRRVTRWR